MKRIFLLAVIFTFFLIPIVMADEGVFIDSINPRRFEVINRTYFGSYIKWTFTEMNDTHWLFNFKIKQELVDDVKYCLGLQKPKRDLCWKYVRQEYKYLNFTDLKTFKTHIKKLSTFPLINLTENIAVSLANINLSQGSGSFYVIFPNGFKEDEKLKFGFDSTYIYSTNIPFESNKRSICRDDQGNIHVTFQSAASIVLYVNSTNNGTSFQGTTIEYTPGHTFRLPSISCSGANVTIAFYDVTDRAIRIYRSTDSGGTFTLKTEPDHSQCDVAVSELGQVQDKGSRIYIGYGCGQMDPTTLYTVCFDRSTDGGSTWDGYDDILILEDLDYWYDIAMEVDGSGDSSDRIYVASYNTLDSDIQFTYSDDGGSNWDTQEVIMSGTYTKPSLAFNSSKIYVVAQTNTNQIYFTNSTDSGATWSSQERIDTSDLASVNPTVTTDNEGYPWVFWQQNQTTLLSWTYNIVYRKYNGTHWLPTDGVYNLTSSGIFSRWPTAKAEFNWDRIEMLYLFGITPDYDLYYDSIILETTPPVYSNNQTNTTGAGQACEFNLTWDDNVALHTTGQYIFSTNNTGTWANASAVSFTATPQNATNVTTLNSTEGTVVAWCFYAKDNEGNWNNTNCESGNWFTLTTTSAGAEYERFFNQGLDLTFTSYKEFDLQRFHQQNMELSEQRTRNFNLQKEFDNPMEFNGQFERNIDFEKWFENPMEFFFEGLRTGDYRRDFDVQLELSENQLRNFDLIKYFDVDIVLSLQLSKQFNLIKSFINPMQLSSNFSKQIDFSRLFDAQLEIETDYQKAINFMRQFDLPLKLTASFEVIFEGAAQIFERFFNLILGFSSEYEKQIDFSRPFDVGIVGDVLFSKQINLGRDFQLEMLESTDYSKQISFIRAFDMPMEMETDFQRIMDVMREFSTGIKLSADFFTAGVPQIFERFFGLILEMRIGFVPTKEFVRCWIYGYVVFDDLDESLFFCKDHYNLYDTFNECYGYCVNYFDEGKCTLFCRLTA